MSCALTFKNSSNNSKDQLFFISLLVVFLQKSLESPQFLASAIAYFGLFDSWSGFRWCKCVDLNRIYSHIEVSVYVILCIYVYRNFNYCRSQPKMAHSQWVKRLLGFNSTMWKLANFYLTLNPRVASYFILSILPMVHSKHNHQEQMLYLRCYV